MSLNARQYRDYLYRNGTHPGGFKPPQAPFEEKGGLAPIYTSILPFLVLEYTAEARFDFLPSGLAFPAGYLLFWAFYYTYYKPGFLEEKLTGKSKWESVGAPAVLLGALIWFVKLVVVEFLDRVILRWMLGIGATKPTAYSRPRPVINNTKQTTASPPPVGGLPKEVSNLLGVLGVAPQCRDWATIQKRYRELAKKHHPDLNSEITSAGNRFMLFDAAYRKLSVVKDKYFQ